MLYVLFSGRSARAFASSLPYRTGLLRTSRLGHWMDRGNDTAGCFVRRVYSPRMFSLQADVDASISRWETRQNLLECFLSCCESILSRKMLNRLPQTRPSRHIGDFGQEFTLATSELPVWQSVLGAFIESQGR